MAETGENHGGEIRAHQQTWSGFVAMMKWGTIASLAVAALVVLLIAQ